jgi:hypothetical protein
VAPLGDANEEPVRRARLIASFPGLGRGHFRITSPADHSYNCFAFAAGETGRCWDPQPLGNLYWPAGAPQQPTLAAFVTAYGTLGFLLVRGPELEAGFEKVAIYVAPDGLVAHAARQLPSGLWASKLGTKEDIEHELAGLEGDRWGVVAVVLARSHTEQVELPL